MSNRFIRTMEINELDEVVAMETSSSLTPWAKAAFIAEMSNPFSSCFTLQGAAGSADSLLAFICFRNIGDESELLNLCVHPGHRRRGLGRELMGFYVDFCSKRNIKTLYLEADALNHPAIRLYQSFSFEAVGIRKRFYRGTNDALLMMKKCPS